MTPFDAGLIDGMEKAAEVRSLRQLRYQDGQHTGHHQSAPPDQTPLDGRKRRRRARTMSAELGVRGLGGKRQQKMLKGMREPESPTSSTLERMKPSDPV